MWRKEPTKFAVMQDDVSSEILDDFGSVESNALATKPTITAGKIYISS